LNARDRQAPRRRIAATEIWAGNAHYRVSDGTIRLADLPATIGWALKEVLVASVLCNDATYREDDDPVERALLMVARAGHLDEATLREVFPRLDRLIVPPEPPIMATLHETAGIQVIYAKGPIERLLATCGDMLDTHGRRWPLATEDITERTAALSANGLTVVALARKAHDSGSLSPAEVAGGMTFVGVVGLTSTPH
jgi:hypothetical protein